MGVMSVSLPPGMQDLLDVSADKMGWNRSELVRQMIKQGLELVVSDEDMVNLVVKLPTETQLMLETAAKKMGCNNSEVVKKLIHRGLDLVTAERGEVPVMFKIPANVRGDELRKWLSIRSDAVVNKLSEKQ